jgi:hypothetical protein
LLLDVNEASNFDRRDFNKGTGFKQGMGWVQGLNFHQEMNFNPGTGLLMTG